MSAPEKNNLDEYEETKFGLLPKDWKVLEFDKCIDPEKIKVGKVKQRENKETGKYPIVDQGKNTIAGYWDNKKDIYSGQLPVIVFGDHTRIVKYIDFPFVCGADGTKVIVPKKTVINPLFFYYALLWQEIPNRGYNRHYHLLKEKNIITPPLTEQERIAFVLRTVQEAVEETEDVISAARELKKSLMKHLFTYGPVSLTDAEKVALKETEIGEMPEQWGVVRLGDVVIQTQYGLSLRGNSLGQYPILRMNNLVGGRLVLSDLQYVDLDDKSFGKFRLNRGDLLFNRTNSIEWVGKTSLFDADEPYVFASYLIRLAVDSAKAKPEYINHYLNMEETQKRMKMLATRGVSQSNINATKLRGFQIPLPPLSLQSVIAENLSVIDDKIEKEESKKWALEELFRSLLRDLMSAKIRVDYLEI